MTTPRVDRIPNLRDVERRRCDQANRRIVDQAYADAGEPLPPHRHVYPSPGDLRGIPVAGGAPGHIRGTQPEHHVLR